MKATLPGSIAPRWTNKSVLRLAQGEDPIQSIERVVRGRVLQAMDEGWSGPPFNPLVLADKLGIPVEALSGIPDARTVPHAGGVKIQFNPTQPRARVRFSIAHEIAHTFFPDVGDAVRNRGGSNTPDGWQLEMLCNIAAAEIVMPIGSLPMQDHMPPITDLMGGARKFDVSAEAFLIRAAKVTSEPVLMFCASTRSLEPRLYSIDYTVSSQGWEAASLRGLSLPSDSVVNECTAIGYSAGREEKWPTLGNVEVECVGIPAYPGALYPRVAGIVRLAGQRPPKQSRSELHYVHGNVLEPQGTGSRIICQLVNDKARRWGGGVAAQSAKQYPQAERAFSSWIAELPPSARLGKVHLSDLGNDTMLASFVAQHGIGPSDQPRLRYAALQACLSEIAEEGARRQASIHLPRVGTSAGGEWERIEQMLVETLVSRGCPVKVYDLPPKRAGREADLFG
jgi:hypothetical protein